MTSQILAALACAALCLAAEIAVGGDIDHKIALVRTSQAHPSTPLPGESLYQLPISLNLANGAAMKLSELRGMPVLITMFYGQCSSVCPLLTKQLQRMTQRLSRSEQRRLKVLMVSFDSGRETPESLTAFALEHHIVGNNWILARASANNVRSLAAALGIQYRELPDHTFNHSTLISLADRNGVIRDKTSDLSDERGDFLTAIRRRLAPAVQPAQP